MKLAGMGLGLKDSAPTFDPANVVDSFSDADYDAEDDYRETEQL
jgi:DNA-directed RNA polymerase subunit alpha